MKQDIVKDLTTEEVRDKINEERASYRKLKLAHAVSPLDNPMKIRNARKVIARLETELKKRTQTQAQ
jgi:large subunit ribosomal protein L29